MFPCLSQACTMPASFADDIAAAAEGGFLAVECWLTKLEKHLESASVADTRRLLDERGVRLAAASYQGGLLVSQGEARAAHLDHFKRRLGLCQAFSIPVLAVVADFLGPVDQPTVERAVASLKEAAQWAQAFDVRLALEFRSRAPFCTCLPTALALVEAAGEPNVGVCLDLFHWYTGPSKPEDLGALAAERLALVQVCDLAGTARELATDADRILPGEGDFALGPILERLRAIGYQGPVSLELLNPDLWRVKPAALAGLGMEALKRLLGEPR
ncbi:MAG: sugar phosphate isomerase/epimerase [Gemmataceae bacterium]|nr:sugar phosphate isomerase/epimerase [Gemmataceae bacterium]